MVGIVGAGTSLSIAIFDFAASVGAAGRELQHVATEISGLCSVLKQLQTILEHAHFQPSSTAVEEVQRIITQCLSVFNEIEEIVVALRGARGDELFPSMDFSSKVKWTFSKKSKVLVLRSTLEACKSTLSVMLITMLLAERVSQRRSSEATLAETEQDKAMTQSLIIAQQCALEELEHYEDEVEKEDDVALQVPEPRHANARANDQKRRKSQNRLSRMFSGLSVVTELPVSAQRLPSRRERASVWLDSIVALPEDKAAPHPGKHRMKRLSSVGTANAPLQLLGKWTDQAQNIDGRWEPQQTIVEHEQVHGEIWQDSKFSFSSGMESERTGNIPSIADDTTIASLTRAPTDLVSPKTARVQSIGFHMVVGVEGALEASSSIAQVCKDVNDDYDAIMRSILQEHGARENVSESQLCVSFGGKIKVLKETEKPLDVLRHHEELELDPRLVIRRKAH